MTRGLKTNVQRRRIAESTPFQISVDSSSSRPCPRRHHRQLQQILNGVMINRHGDCFTYEKGFSVFAPLLRSEARERGEHSTNTTGENKGSRLLFAAEREKARFTAQHQLVMGSLLPYCWTRDSVITNFKSLRA